MSTELLPKEVESLRDWVRDQSVGTVRVLSVEAVRGEDASGEPAIFFDVVLSGPETGEETWAVEDVLGLHESIDHEARLRGLGLPWYVRIFPEHDVEAELEDPDE
jgi:hypothetical protein